ncbi:MAG TPA: hypothetical protein VJ742_08575 [Nitrososphaera sp.]|nr:hypothetical protein [Nitrososphaera sp.]
MEIAEAVTTGEQTFPEGMLQMAGKVGAGSVFDVIGEGISAVGRGISAVTPDIIEDPIKAGVKGYLKYGELPRFGGKAAGGYQEFAQENPRAARNIEAATNLGLLLAPTPGGARKPSQPTIVGKAASQIDDAAKAQIAKRKQKFVEDLLKPVQTKAVKEDQVARTVEVGRGPFKKSIIQPTKKEAAAIEEVMKISDVGAKETIQGNVNIISKEIGKEAEFLKSTLKTNDVPFPRREFSKKLRDVRKTLEDNPILVGDTAKTADKIINQLEKIMAGKKSTASNLLEARKELDQWILRLKKQGQAFDPATENAVSIALREIRNTTNDFVSEKVKSVPVKESLKKQHNLYNAIDIATPKAAEEFDTALRRAWQRATKIVKERSAFTQTAGTAAGIGIIGASTLFAPVYTALLAAGGIGYFGTKAALSPAGKKALAKTLRVTDRAIRLTKDKQLLEQLRADRATLLEIAGASKEEIMEQANDVKSRMEETRNSGIPNRQKRQQIEELNKEMGEVFDDARQNLDREDFRELRTSVR